jgi:energy-coupling factor transport system substrate-specific component
VKARRLVSLLLIFIIIPATILYGALQLGDRKYYFISLLIVLYTMVPFFLLFEHRRPQARELIVISVLSAIGVASRAAFWLVPQFKPAAAVVIIAGVCLGGETGFLVGALTAFVSNFFFGQGPWTPWQMFAFGLIGFLAGILFRKNHLPRKRIPLCIYGGISTLVIYGGIVNLSSFLIFQTGLTWEAVFAVYAAGFWFDLIHASATVLFLLILSKPMIKMLERIQTKYGILE